MGLFTKKICPICGNEAKGLASVKISDNQKLCANCAVKMDMEFSMIQFQTVDDIKEHLKEREANQIEYNKFKPTNEKKALGILFREDANMKKWFFSYEKNPTNPTLFSYDQIVDYELTENGESISKGGLGSAVAGGILFGGVGAVVGGITGKKKVTTEIKNMTLRVSLNHKYKNQLIMNLIPLGTSVKSNSMSYNLYKHQANDIISFLDGLCKKASISQTITPSQQVSSADEIMKYKDLLDKGIITQEEFELKKKQILSL